MLITTMKELQMKDLFTRFFYTILGFIFIFSSLSFKPLSTKNNTTIPNPPEKIESIFFSKKHISDGPYIFYEGDQIIVKWIHYNRLKEKKIRKNNFTVLNRKFGINFDPDWIEQINTDTINYTQNYNGVENLIAVSDIHGQYNLLVKLLRKHKVIDKQFNWIFNNGHLVVLGDIFDRGPDVTKILWLIFSLEQQAKEKGGMVHVMMGNHELMVLNKDLRYIHEKYTKSSKLMSTTYDKLYSENTFLGKWLRKKPVIVKINDMLFVHAGVSPKLVELDLTQTQINKLFLNEIIDKSDEIILADPKLSLLRGKYGPVWYRGYFEDPKITENVIDDILKKLNVNHIIVGHSSMPNIISLHNGKIIGIDSSIKYGDYGEVLIYKKGEYHKGTASGSIIHLDTIDH